MIIKLNPLNTRFVNFFFIFMFVLVLFVPWQLFTTGVSFFGDEIFVNYWSWRGDWDDFLYVLPTGQHDDRPLGWLFINFLYELFGLNYRAQLFAILIVHYCNALLVFLLARKIFRKDAIAMTGALVFSLHFPANTAAMYIGAIFDLLCCTFILASLVCYVCAEQQRSRWQLFFSVFFFYLSLRSKEMSLLLPVVIISFAVINYSFVDDTKTLVRRMVKAMPFFAMSLLVIVLFWIGGRIGGKPVSPTSPYFMEFSFETFFSLLNHYCSRLTWIPPTYFPAVIIMSFFLPALYWRHRILIWSLLSFVLIFLPVLFYRNHVFDIFLYVPHVFFAMIVCSIIDLFNDRVKVFLRPVGECVLVLLVLIVMLATTQSQLFGSRMISELENRRSVYELVDYLRTHTQIEQYNSIYIVGLPKFYVRQGINWHLSNVMCLVYHVDTFSVFTGNDEQNLYQSYQRDAGKKMFLRYDNGFVLVAQSDA